MRLKGLSPKFLNGTTGAVEIIRQTRVSVRFDDDTSLRVKQRCPGGTVNVPANCVEKI